jgi:hypothetical protein
VREAGMAVSEEQEKVNYETPTEFNRHERESEYGKKKAAFAHQKPKEQM